MIKYKNYLIEQESSHYNLYKEVDYEKREGFGKNAPTTGGIGVRQESLGFGLKMENVIPRIIKDQLIDFDGELKDYLSEYKNSNTELLDYFKSINM